MSKSMVRPSEILVTLKQRDDANASTMKTIYNARHRYKVAENAGRSQMQQLLGQLAMNKYIEWHKSCADTETVTDLFFAHPTSLKLLHAFLKVLLMDCTYKTNRYRFPLLQIVDKELALMNAICTVFPATTNLLYRWHIRKNVLANCKKMFETKDKWEMFIMSWNMLVMSSSEEEYIQRLSLLYSEFSTYQDALHYVTLSWLDPYKSKFVAAWTDTFMHFGNSTTNRCVVRRTHGLPYAHEIANYMRENRPIPLTSVYSYWTKLDMLSTPHIEVDPDMKRFLLQKLRELAKPDCTFLIEPEVKSNPRGRPKLKIETSTRREPSVFEIVASAQDSYSPGVIAKTSVTTKKVKTKKKEKDVAADGNSGFQAIAGLMGFGEE
ncbi:uncharacterized protein LOC114282577 [Camellia sinensis]|uniref:uncharacterized protein LOC114282577 n=1 Tax=Camellia sinensis TaxID=4442 RepID=UPI00103555FA|nr:uncharacterized protein LOC114282577 [Camellia sinensis]